MSHKITVYTTSQCAFCLMVKKFLDSKGQTYQTVNLEDQPEKRGEVEKLSGVRSVPVTVFERENKEPIVIVGWNPAKLTEAIEG